ncbi:MAG: hypothetical protein EAY81_04120 [Bacteroidetes bacterium]|nr:MAG: hypothetical protein EAY81_04120 [Bacteroidota bacterium]
MLSIKNILIVFVIAVAAAVAVQFASSWLNPTKVAWLNVSEVYNDFQLKKGLEKKLEKQKQTYTNSLDSVEYEINLLSSSKANAEAIEFKKQVYFKMKKHFEMETEKLRADYQAQIFNQINQYVKDYAEQHRYRYIWGANGEGTLMYAVDDQNITIKIKTYVNNRYTGEIAK